MKKDHKAETQILEGMTRWQEVVKCELAELKEEIGRKRQICFKSEDKVGRLSRESRHWKIQCGTYCEWERQMHALEIREAFIKIREKMVAIEDR